MIISFVRILLIFFFWKFIFSIILVIWYNMSYIYRPLYIWLSYYFVRFFLVEIKKIKFHNFMIVCNHSLTQFIIITIASILMNVHWMWMLTHFSMFQDLWKLSTYVFFWYQQSTHITELATLLHYTTCQGHDSWERWVQLLQRRSLLINYSYLP